MKNTLLSIVMVMALAVVGAGCGKKPQTTEAGGAKKLTIWWAQWKPADGLQELATEYQKETGVEVEVVQIPWPSYQDKVFVEYGNSKTSFDIVVGDSQWIGRGAESGLYVDLTTWLPGAVDLSTVQTQAKEYLCQYPVGSGKYYAAPCETDAMGFAYRKDWFEDPAEQAAFKAKYNRDLAVPKTWDEFYQVASFFQRPDKKQYGCALLTGRGYDELVMGYQQFLWANGGSWGDPKTFEVQGAVNGPGAVAGLSFMKKLVSETTGPDGANLSYGNTLEAITNGSTAMIMDYFAFFPAISKQMGDKVGFFPVPTNAEGKRFVSLGGQGFSISTKTSTAQQEQAKLFIAWFLKTETQKKWITKEGGFTANVEILKSEAFKSASPYNAAFAESLDSMQDFWNVPVYNELLAAAQGHIGEALDGKAEPQAALDALAKDHAMILKDAGYKK